MKRATLRLAAASLFAALPLVAAADTTAEQAAGLRAQLRAWAAHLAGPDVEIPDKLIEVAPEGDHYRVAVALGALPGIAVAEGGTISAAAHPAPAGRWRIDDLRFASPSKLTLGGQGAPDGAGITSVTASLAKTRGEGVLDPSFATPTRLDAGLEGYDVGAVGPKARFHTKIERVSGRASVTPASPGRIDIEESAVAENYSSQQQSGALPPVDFAARRMDAKLSIAALDPDRVPPLIHAIARLFGPPAAAAMEHPAANKGAVRHGRLDTPEGRQALREAYLAFRGIAAQGALSETIEGIRITAAGHPIGVDRLELGGGVATPGGTLKARLALAVHGIASADIPPDVQPYVPHRIEIAPSVSGISLADLDGLIMAASAPPSEHPDLDARIAALMAHGITAGLDTLGFDLGPARFSGSGRLLAFGPDKIKGEAEIKATGFDQLTQDAMKTPALGQAVPALAIMRSLARPDGDALLWSVRLENSVVTVNGHDLSAMFGAGKGRPEGGGGSSR